MTENNDQPSTVIRAGLPFNKHGDRYTNEVMPNGDVEVGVMRRLRDGMPISATEQLCEMRYLGGGRYEKRPMTGGGPPKVSSPAYRAGWDSIFGKQPIAEA